MIKIRKFALRLLVFPFVLGIIVVRYNFAAIGQALGFIRFGGEWITYSIADKQTIKDIFEELKKGQ